MTEEYIKNIMSLLEYWSSWVSSGYECPAAGNVMFQAKMVIEHLIQENKNIRSSVDKGDNVMSEDILKKADELIKKFDKSCSEQQRIEIGTHAINLLNELLRRQEIVGQSRK